MGHGDQRRKGSAFTFGNWTEDHYTQRDRSLVIGAAENAARERRARRKQRKKSNTRLRRGHPANDASPENTDASDTQHLLQIFCIEADDLADEELDDLRMSPWPRHAACEGVTLENFDPRVAVAFDDTREVKEMLKRRSGEFRPALHIEMLSIVLRYTCKEVGYNLVALGDYLRGKEGPHVLLQKGSAEGWSGIRVSYKTPWLMMGEAGPERVPNIRYLFIKKD